MGRIEERLRELGIEIPPATAPMANYVPAVRTGNLVYTAGQVSRSAQGDVQGKLGRDLDVEQGRAAARQCAINALAALLTQLDSLDQVRRVVRVGGFVNSAPGFDQQPAVMNGASDLLVEVFGEAGKHARTAVGVNELPLGYAVEVELVVEVGGST